MSDRSRFLGWGVFLVCLGIVPLSVQLSWVDAPAAASVLRLWPFIIIGIGISLALHWTRCRTIGRVISGAAVGLVLGVVFAGGAASFAFACSGNSTADQVATQTGSFAGPSAVVNVELTCGSVQMSRTAGPGWSVGVAAGGVSPVVNAGPASLDLRSGNERIMGPFPGGTDEHWQIGLPAATAVSVGVTLNAAHGDISLPNRAVDSVGATLNGADGSMDLRGATGMTGLSTTLNASSLRLYLPNAPYHASVTLNVASLTVCLARDAAVDITYTNTLGSQNFAAAGLQGSGEHWYTPGASTSSLHVTSNLSSLTLDRSGECK